MRRTTPSVNNRIKWIPLKVHANKRAARPGSIADLYLRNKRLRARNTAPCGKYRTPTVWFPFLPVFKKHPYHKVIERAHDYIGQVRRTLQVDGDFKLKLKRPRKKQLSPAERTDRNALRLIPVSYVDISHKRMGMSYEYKGKPLAQIIDQAEKFVQEHPEKFIRPRDEHIKFKESEEKGGLSNKKKTPRCPISRIGNPGKSYLYPAYFGTASYESGRQIDNKPFGASFIPETSYYEPRVFKSAVTFWKSRNRNEVTAPPTRHKPRRYYKDFPHYMAIPDSVRDKIIDAIFQTEDGQRELARKMENQLLISIFLHLNPGKKLKFRTPYQLIHSVFAKLREDVQELKQIGFFVDKPAQERIIYYKIEKRNPNAKIAKILDVNRVQVTKAIKRIRKYLPFPFFDDKRGVTQELPYRFCNKLHDNKIDRDSGLDYIGEGYRYI